MIVINPVLGGIGNQLFQITALLNVMQGAELKVDTTLFSKTSGANESKLKNMPLFREIEFRNYDSWSWTTRRLAGLTLRFTHFQKMSRFPALIFRYLYLSTQFFFSQRYGQKIYLLCPSGTGFESNNIPSRAKCVVMLGYFQSYRYQDWGSFSKADLVLQSDALKMRIQTWEPFTTNVKPLIVHIRRGDYLVNGHLGVLASEYYLRNIPLVFEKSGSNVIWVFSNENSVVGDFIPQDLKGLLRVFPSSGFTDLETLEVMKLGHAYLTANSTFSWWAACLSKAKPENIYVPSPWHAGIPDPIQLSPDEWDPLASVFES